MDPMGNLQRKNSEIPPFNLAKQESNPKKEAISNLSQEAFDHLKRHSDENEELVDSEHQRQIAEKILASMHPISEFNDSPFSDTDLIVFKDEYKGTLPRNGIKERELALINQIYNDISNDKCEIRIDKSDINFKKEILMCIKTLMTREIGRKLIKKMISLNQETVIIHGEKCEVNGNVIFMNLNQKVDIVVQEPSGKLNISTLPLFLTFGHEMIHVTHNKIKDNNALKSPTLGKEYDNLEEQITITGLKKGLSINAASSNDESWEPIIAEDFDELNEQNLTGAFTGSLTEFYSKVEEARLPRYGHSSHPTVNLEYVEFLHQKGYNFNQLDTTGNSILHYAVLSYMPIVINQLKEWKCDFNIKNDKGETPYDYLINQTLESLDELKKQDRIVIVVMLDRIEQLINDVYQTLKVIDESRKKIT